LAAPQDYGGGRNEQSKLRREASRGAESFVRQSLMSISVAVHAEFSVPETIMSKLYAIKTPRKLLVSSRDKA
jgi:hypothetical protein